MVSLHNGTLVHALNLRRSFAELLEILKPETGTKVAIISRGTAGGVSGENDMRGPMLLALPGTRSLSLTSPRHRE